MSMSTSWKNQFVETKVIPPIKLVEHFGRPVVRWEGEGLRTLALLNPTSLTDGKSLDLESLDDDESSNSTEGEYSGLIKDKDMNKDGGEQAEEKGPGRTEDKRRDDYTKNECSSLVQDRDYGRVYDANLFRIKLINNDGGSYEFRNYNELKFRKTDFRPFVVDWLIINQIEKLFEVTEVRHSGRSKKGPLGRSDYHSRRPLISVKYVEQGRQGPYQGQGIPCVKIPPEKIMMNTSTKCIMRSKMILGQNCSFLLYEPTAVVDVRSFFKENLGSVGNYQYHYDCHGHHLADLGHHPGAFHNWLQRWQEYSRIYHPILVNSESPSFCNDPQKHYCPSCRDHFGPEITLLPYNYTDDPMIIMKIDDIGDLYSYAIHACSV